MMTYPQSTLAKVTSYWVDGRNVRIDYRFAGGDVDRIRTYVRELVTSAPDLILANGSPVIAELKRTTGTIPVVFAVVSDPVNQGFVTSLAHPGATLRALPSSSSRSSASGSNC
jgi:putative ABC transport system substrate-binding protein